jgi:predicted nucleic acid-binding protein
MRCFIDTNVWLYALIDVREADRTRIAREIVRKPDIAPSALRRQCGLSFWDSLIAAAALMSGSEILYSEDMHHGLMLGERLRIVNPFLPAEAKGWTARTTNNLELHQQSEIIGQPATMKIRR